MTSTSCIQTALKPSPLLSLLTQTKGLAGALGTFETFFSDLEKSPSGSKDDFKKVLLQSGKELGDVQKAAEAFLMEVKEWKKNLGMYAQLWK